MSVRRQVSPATDTETAPSLLWFATIQCIESKQDLASLAPKDCFIPAKPVERVAGQIGQTQKATCEVGGGINGRPADLPSRKNVGPSLLLSTDNCRTSSPRRVIMSSARKKPVSPKREYKSQRLELRLAPSAKKVIQQAMSVTGLAAGDLAYEGARRLLDEHQRMVLSGADRDAFLAAIRQTPDPSPRLVEALKRHRHLFG